MEIVHFYVGTFFCFLVLLPARNDAFPHFRRLSTKRSPLWPTMNRETASVDVHRRFLVGPRPRTQSDSRLRATRRHVSGDCLERGNTLLYPRLTAARRSPAQLHSGVRLLQTAGFLGHPSNQGLPSLSHSCSCRHPRLLIVSRAPRDSQVDIGESDPTRHSRRSLGQRERLRFCSPPTEESQCTRAQTPERQKTPQCVSRGALTRADDHSVSIDCLGAYGANLWHVFLLAELSPWTCVRYPLREKRRCLFSLSVAWGRRFLGSPAWSLA